MDDEPFYTPNRKPDPPREPTAGEPPFALLRGHVRFLCELRDHGAYGIEAQFYENEDFLVSRRFGTRTLAVQWAEEERKAIERGPATRMTKDQPALSRVDGLPVRDSGPWAVEKLYYVRRYMSIFNAGMKNLWAQRGYIDLMAGPGRGIDRETNDEFDGSPLLALQCDPPFTQAVFVDDDPDSTSALSSRTESQAARRTVLTADCNAPATIAEVRRIIGSNTLTLCFVDNLGLNVVFETIRALVAGGRPIDLIFTFQVNDLTRNIDEALTSAADGARFDAFFGEPRWREVIARHDRGEGTRSDRATALADFYGEQLGTLGYGQVAQLHRLMKNTRNAPLYRLLLASQHPRAVDFFHKIARIEHDGQRGFRFDG